MGVWLAEFLRNRYQIVACDGHKSTKSAVTSGVPQGTVLGPVLFLVLISDIADGTDAATRVSSFADDTRASKPILVHSDSGQLQSDLNKIYTWANRVNMTFNGDKFEVLRCWPETKNWTQHLPFSLRNESEYLDSNGESIEEKEHIKDLGVIMSADLTFSKHIETTAKSCRRLTGWILRTFKTRTRDVMLMLWKSLIQSRLDYCSQLWSPSKAAEIKLLEDIQRNFTCKINGMEELNYRERLKKLKLSSQERRRERYAVIFIWKVAMNLVSGYTMEFSSQSRFGRRAVIRTAVTTAPANVVRAREASMAVKGAKIFNMLPTEIRNIDSDKTTVFKKSLDKYLGRIQDEPTIEDQGRAAESNLLLHQIPQFRLASQ